MRRQLALRPAVWVGIPALAGGTAALLLPGTTSAASAEAALLAVAALALFAGHTWGLLLALTTHVPLVGRVWPSLGVANSDDFTALAAAVVLVTALPVVMLSVTLLPRMLEHLLPGQSPRARSLCVAVMALGLAMSLVLPAAV